MSHHATRIKHSTVLNLFKMSVIRSCPCNTDRSLHYQEMRCLGSGYSRHVIQSSKEKLILGFHNESDEKKRVRYAVMPYIHGVSNRLSKIAGKQDVKIATSYRHQLKSLPRRISFAREESKLDCRAKHVGIDSFRCETSGVVYELGLDCGAKYIGETGRCPNIRLLEHLDHKKNKDYSTLRDHINDCGCSIDVSACRIMATQLRNMYSRRIIESITMVTGGKRRFNYRQQTAR